MNLCLCGHGVGVHGPSGECECGHCSHFEPISDDEQERRSAAYKNGETAGRAFQRRETAIWLAHLAEQGYLPFWVRDAYRREFS